MELIASRRNAIAARFRAAARRDVDEHGARRWLLEGRRLIREAVDAGVAIEIAAIDETRFDRASGDRESLLHALRSHGARIVRVSSAVMDALSPARTPSGLIALAEPQTTALSRLGDRPATLAVVLVDVQDPGNVGAVVRVAEAAGAEAVVAAGACADPFGWRALRGSMGSAFRMTVIVEPDCLKALDALRGLGLAVIATAPRGGVDLHAADLRSPAAVLIGGEGAGLTRGQLADCDAVISIPMRAPVESLNAAVTAGVILYEAARQRAAHA